MNKKNIAALLTISFVMISIPLGVYLVQREQNLRSKAIENTVTASDIADADGDLCVSQNDYDIWLDQFKNASGASADFDKNGVVGPEDYALWLKQFNGHQYECVSPTP